MMNLAVQGCSTPVNTDELAKQDDAETAEDAGAAKPETNEDGDKAASRAEAKQVFKVLRRDPNARGFTMHDAVATALDHSSKVRSAKAELARAAVQVDIAYAGYQPVLQSSAGIGSDDEDGDAQVSLRQPLFDWGHTNANVSGAKARRIAALADLDDERETAAREAAEAFLAVKHTGELAAAARENVTVYERIAGLAKDRVDGGVGDETEVQMAGVHLGEAESNLEEALGALRNARSLYYSRIGREASRLAAAPELPIALDDLKNTDEAVNAIPAVAAAREREQAAKDAARAERASLLPKLSAEVYVQAEDSFNDVDEGVGLRVTGPTLAGLSNFRRVEAARIEADNARWVAETARRDAKRRVQEFLDQVPTKRSRLIILNAQYKNATALRDLYEDQFKLGERSLVDLVNVQADVFRIKRTLTNVRYEILELQYGAAGALGVLRHVLGLEQAGERI